MRHQPDAFAVSRIFVPDCGDGRMQELERRLTFRNPEYVKALRLGRPCFWMDPMIRAYEEDVSGGIWVPRGAVRHVLESLGEGTEIAWWTSVKSDPMPVSVPLRDYQEAAAEAFIAARQGHVVVPCGGGKTRIALGIIGRLGLKAAVLVPTRDLVAQWESNAESLGLGGLVDVYTVQGLKEPPECDVLVLDEAHHVAASTFRDIVDRSEAHYRLGLTATPEREDGLTEFLEVYLGPKVYDVTHEYLVRRGVLVVPKVVRVDTWFGYEYDGTSSYAPMMDALVSDDDRNSRIVDVVRGAMSDGGVGLVLTGRIAHCEKLAAMLWEAGVKALELTSEISRSERLRRLSMARSGDVSVLVATTLADEGLDLPNMSKVFLAYPSRAAGRTIQRVGRLMRPCEGKGEAVLYDFVDPVGPLLSQFRRRCSVYRKYLGVEVGRCEA